MVHGRPEIWRLRYDPSRFGERFQLDYPRRIGGAACAGEFKDEEKDKRLWRIVPHQNENDLQAQKDAADRGEREGEEE